MAHEAGKGDKQRPTDKEKFDNNYDQIFRKKPTEQERALAVQALVRQDAMDKFQDVVKKQQNNA